MQPKHSADKRLVALMVTLVLFSPLAIDIYLPALPAMADTFAVDLTRVQDTVTWFMFSLGLGQLLAGPLADRFGRRPIALGGIAIYGASAALAYVAQTLDMLLVARLLQGFGACATSVAAFAAVRDSFGPREKRPDDQLPQWCDLLYSGIGTLAWYLVDPSVWLACQLQLHGGFCPCRRFVYYAAVP